MNSSYIGNYILRQVPESAEHLNMALAIQLSLFKKGELKNIGQILTENGWISEKDLKICLALQMQAQMSEIDIFESIPIDLLLKIATESHVQTFFPGETVFEYGDKNDSYFVIVAGSVIITKTGDSNSAKTGMKLGPDDCFSERALFCGSHCSARVIAEEKTTLISIPETAFKYIKDSKSSASKEFIHLLSERLIKSSDWISRVKSDEEAYRHYISEQLRKHEPAIIGDGAVIQKVYKEIEKAAGCKDAVLVAGDQGTEIFDAALMIQMRGINPGQLFSYNPLHKSIETPEVSSECCYIYDDMLSQMNALFGRMGPMLTGKARRAGLIEIADGETLIVEHVEMLHQKVQQLLADFIMKKTYSTPFDETVHSSNVRLIFTGSSELNALVEKGLFNSQLYSLISVNSILLPPLKKRKSDLRKIVEYCIKRNNVQLGMSIEGIEENAFKMLIAYDWPGNVEELDNTIRRAMMLARYKVLKSENIFISSPPVKGQLIFDLFNIPAVKSFFRNKNYYSLLQLAIAPFIALIIIEGIFGIQDAAKNAVIVLAWGYWEPIMVASTFFAGRFWCSACPIGASASIISRFGFKLKVPDFIRDYGLYFAAAGIAVIIWSESVTHMMKSPAATGFLVLSILLSALITSVIFEKRTWCRYLCPLGCITGYLSSCSITELRSDYNICSKDCTNHDCHTGNDEEEGCPMFHGPFSLRNNKDCILCGNCVRICRSSSAKLNLRIPGQELWSSHQLEKGLVLISVVMLGTQLFRSMENTGMFDKISGASSWCYLSAILLVILTIPALLVAEWKGASLKKTGNNNTGTGALIIYSFIPVIVSVEILHHAGEMLQLSGMLPDVILYYLTGREGDPITPVVTSGGIKTLQIIMLLFGLAGSLFTSKKLNSKDDFRDQIPIIPAILLAIIFIFLIIAGR